MTSSQTSDAEVLLELIHERLSGREDRARVTTMNLGNETIINVAPTADGAAVIEATIDTATRVVDIHLGKYTDLEIDLSDADARRQLMQTVDAVVRGDFSEAVLGDEADPILVRSRLGTGGPKMRIALSLPALFRRAARRKSKIVYSPY